jgi:hypothetical protein
MRFPVIGFVYPVFDLSNGLGIAPESGMLIEYLIAADNKFKHCNGRHARTPLGQGDIFRFSIEQGGSVPNNHVVEGVDNIANTVSKFCSAP